MCYHLSQKKGVKELETRFKAKYEGGLEDKVIYHTSAFTFPKWKVITSEKPNVIDEYYWGLVPSWTKDEKQAKEMRQHTINAKSETIFEKPSFRNSILPRRCLVLIDGFYEFHDRFNKKFPYYIHLKKDEVFAVGGIYDNWTNTETGEIFQSFAIVTTAANPLLSEIHNVKKRMPVILNQEMESEWIKGEINKEALVEMMKTNNQVELEAYTVSKGIIKGVDSEEAIKPFEYAELKTQQQSLF